MVWICEPNERGNVEKQGYGKVMAKEDQRKRG